MHCEFCDTSLPTDIPENVALMDHIGTSRRCNEQFGYMIDNLHASWTPNMSGG